MPICPATQLGWRASDESNDLSLISALRYGELYAYVDSVILTREGASAQIRIKARGWRQRRSKAEAIDLVASHFKHGEWTPLLTAWLGDGGPSERWFYMVNTSWTS
jgi:hypothetical protein